MPVKDIITFLPIEDLNNHIID
jgi:hypothetical protein